MLRQDIYLLRRNIAQERTWSGMMPTQNRHFQQIVDRHTRALDYNDQQLPLLLVREIPPDAHEVEMYFGRAWVAPDWVAGEGGHV